MTRIRLALEWFLNPDHVPLLVALEKGWFTEADLDLELVEPQEHFDAFRGMEEGTIEVAVTEPIHLVQDVAKGDAMVGFARFLHTNGGVMYLRDRGISRPRDMVGRRVQYPGAPGPGGLAIVRTMIAADGGPTDATLEPVNNGFFHTDALVEDKADVATLAFYNFEVVEARHRGLDADFFALKDWGVPDFCQLILVSTPSWLEANEAAARALVAVIRRGIDFLQQHPDEAEAIYWSRTGGDPSDPLMRAIWRATVPCFTHDLSMAGDYYDRLAGWLVETGQIASADAADGCWTNRLVL